MNRQRATRELESIYADLQRELDELRPLCRLSGRCCRFGQSGQQLWTTRLELEFLLEHQGTPQEVQDGVCPYLSDGLCGVRDHRMLGCRVFFCDETYQSTMGPLYEKYHRRVRDLHSRFEIPYEYREFMGEITRIVGERQKRSPA